MLFSVSKTKDREPWKQCEFSVSSFGWTSKTLENFTQMSCERVWSHITWDGDRRLGDNFTAAHCLVLDYDERLSIQDVKNILDVRGLTYVIGTTKNHQISKNGNEPCDRFRVVIPFDKPITCGLIYKQNMLRFVREFYSDQACIDLARCWQPFREIVCIQTGVPIKWKPYKKPRESYYEESLLPPVWLSSMINKVPSPGERNDHAFKLAATLAKYGYSEDSIVKELLSGKIDLPENELRVCAKSGYKNGSKNRARLYY